MTLCCGWRENRKKRRAIYAYLQAVLQQVPPQVSSRHLEDAHVRPPQHQPGGGVWNGELVSLPRAVVEELIEVLVEGSGADVRLEGVVVPAGAVFEAPGLVAHVLLLLPDKTVVLPVDRVLLARWGWDQVITHPHEWHTSDDVIRHAFDVFLVDPQDDVGVYGAPVLVLVADDVVLDPSVDPAWNLPQLVDEHVTIEVLPQSVVKEPRADRGGLVSRGVRCPPLHHEVLVVGDLTPRLFATLPGAVREEEVRLAKLQQKADPN
jgi:hypothetical protein